MTILKEIKIRVRLITRFLKDLVSLKQMVFASKKNGDLNYNYSIEIIQEIKHSETFENKLFNLLLASRIINEYEIKPNEIFSFWEIVGNPKHKFKSSRTIQNGEIVEDVGGGICQVTGIIYHISILAGLQILERYNHSVDIYSDETRFTPLGLDATVVYGYKDLRIKNHLSFPIRFEIEVNNCQIKIKLLSTEKIQEKSLVIKSDIDGLSNYIMVMDENGSIVNNSKYIKSIGNI